MNLKARKLLFLTFLFTLISDAYQKKYLAKTSAKSDTVKEYENFFKIISTYNFKFLKIFSNMEKSKKGNDYFWPGIRNFLSTLKSSEEEDNCKQQYDECLARQTTTRPTTKRRGCWGWGGRDYLSCW